MSKLDDILTDATATAYCAGQDWSKSNPTTDKVDSTADEAKQQIKELMLDVIGEDLSLVDKLGREYNYDSPAGVKTRLWNLSKAEIRQKVEEL